MATQERTKLWGAETDKAVANFPVSGDPVKLEVVHWLGRIKAAAARENGELGLLDAELRVLSRTGFLMAYDDPVGVARELAAFCR